MERAIYRGVKLADKLLQTAIDLAFILILLIGLYFLADTVYVYGHSRADITMPYKPVDGDAAVLKELSEDCVGWITIDGSGVDYPIMQGVDNYEYLNKDPYGDYSLAGSIYLDSRNSPDFTDPYSILYGHHMSGGYMFGALDDFADAAFFGEHRTGTLTTGRGALPVRVLAFLYTDAGNELVFDPEEGQAEELADWIRQEAEHYNTDAEGGPIVALSTCKSPTSTRRLIVFVTIPEG